MARRSGDVRIAGAGAGRVWEAVLCRDAVGSDAGRLPAAGASEAAFWGGSDRESGASVIKNRAQAQVLADVSHFAHLGARRRERLRRSEAGEQRPASSGDHNARGNATPAADDATPRDGGRRRPMRRRAVAPPGAATSAAGGARTHMATRPAQAPPAAPSDERITERSPHLRQAVRQRRAREMKAYVHQLADKSREFARKDVFPADVNRARIETRATVAFRRELSERRVAARVQSEVWRALHPGVGAGQPQSAMVESTAAASGLLQHVRARHQVEKALRGLAGRARQRAAGGDQGTGEQAVASDAADARAPEVPRLRLPSGASPVEEPSSGPPSRDQRPRVGFHPRTARTSPRGHRPRPPTTSRRPRTTRHSRRDGAGMHPLIRSAREVQLGPGARGGQRSADASPAMEGAEEEADLLDRAQRIVGADHGAATPRPPLHVERLSQALEREQRTVTPGARRTVPPPRGTPHGTPRGASPSPRSAQARSPAVPASAGQRSEPGTAPSYAGRRAVDSAPDDARVSQLWEAALRVKGELTEGLTKISDNDLPLRMYPPLLHLPTYYGGAPELEGLAEPGDAGDEGGVEHGEDGGGGEEPREGAGRLSTSPETAARGARASVDLAHGARHVASEAVKRLDGLLPPGLVRELSRRVHRLGRRSARKRSSHLHAVPSMGQAHLIDQLSRAREQTSGSLSPRARLSGLHGQSWSERATAESPMLAQGAQRRRAGEAGPSDPFHDLAMVEEEGSLASSEDEGQGEDGGTGGDAASEGGDTVSVATDDEAQGGGGASLLGLSGSLQGTWSVVADAGELLNSCPAPNPTRGLLSVGSPQSRAEAPGSPPSIFSTLSFSENAPASPARAKGWVRVRNRLLRSEALGAIRRKDPEVVPTGGDQDSEAAYRLDRLLAVVAKEYASPQPAVLATDRGPDSDSDSEEAGSIAITTAARAARARGRFRAPQRTSSFESRGEGTASSGVAGAGAEHLDGPLFALPAQLLVDGRRVAALRLHPHIAPQRAALHELRGEDVVQLIQPVWTERVQPPLPPVLEGALRRCIEREWAAARRGGGEVGKEPVALLDTAVGGVSVRSLLLRATLHGRPVLSRGRRVQVESGASSADAAAAAWGEPVEVRVRGGAQRGASPDAVRVRLGVEEANAVEGACEAAFREGWVRGVRAHARNPANAMDFLPGSAAAEEAVAIVKAARAEGKEGAGGEARTHRGGGHGGGELGASPVAATDKSPHRLVAVGDPRRWEWISLHRVRTALMEQQRQWDGGLSQPQSTGSQSPRPLPPGFVEVLEEAWDALDTPLSQRIEFILRYGRRDARHLLPAATRGTLEVASAWGAFASACQDMQSLRAGIIRRAATAALPRFEERLTKAFETSQHEMRVAAAAERLAVACVQASRDAGLVPSIGSASAASHLLPLLRP